MQSDIYHPPGKDSHDAAAETGRNVQMRFLCQKYGKNAVPDDVENEKIRITGLPAREPERAKIGEMIWFMYSPDNSHSSHWIQGELERRVDRYTRAKESGFTKNRFIVKNLRIINSWNGMCIRACQFFKKFDFSM